MLKRCVGVVLGLLSAPSAALAGAWTLPEGTGQVVRDRYREHFDQHISTVRRPVTSTPRYNKDELQAL